MGTDRPNEKVKVELLIPSSLYDQIYVKAQAQGSPTHVLAVELIKVGLEHVRWQATRHPCCTPPACKYQPTLPGFDEPES